ncbi:MAG: hypothetical protein ACKVW3_17155 [Phycisphaerales bacterium]
MTTPAPTPTPPPPRKSHRGRRMLIQIIGLAAGLASLGWCVSMAFRPENKDQWSRLADAPMSLILAVLGCSAATLIINGLVFWITLRPARELRVLDVQAVNAVSTFLGYLPLKLGAVARVLIHRRRDHVPLPMIGAWFAAIAVIMTASFTPPIATVMALKRMDATWAALTLALTVVAAVIIVLVARAFRGQIGLGRLIRLLHALRLGRAERLLRSSAWGNLHAGFDMLASPAGVGSAMLLRAADVACHTARFVVAAQVFGLNPPLHQAVPIALVFYLLSVVSPSGAAGLREGAATGIAAVLLASAGATADVARQYAPVARFITGTEAVVYLVGGALGIAWLRPDRLLRLKAPASA